MTDEEFYALPYEQQMALLQQRQQAKAMQGQQPQGGMNPGMAMQVGQQFMGGGAAGGEAAAGGAAGGESALASAGPWAALAAAIYLNESQAKDKGRRDEDSSSRLLDQFSGAVLEQDAEILGDKIGGPLGKATEFMGEMGNPEGIFKNIGKSLKPWEIFDKWF